MRKLRLAAHRPRPAALVAAGLATALLGITAAIASEDGAEAADPDRPAATTVITVHDDGRPGGRGDDNRDGRIDEDESGWDCHTMGNRTCGTFIVPKACQNAGTAFGLCVTVARRPAYDWTNPDGSRIGNPDGRAQIRDLDETPGTREFVDALRALDAEWRAHH